MISPIEVKKQEFDKSLRGYDQAKVRAFLEMLALDFETLQDNLRKLEKENTQLKAELSSLKKIENELNTSLITAKESAHDARTHSQKEAELIRREAELEAEKIIREAYRKHDEVIRDMEDLVNRKDSLIRKLKSLYQSEMDLIKLLELEPEDEKNTIANE